MTHSLLCRICSEVIVPGSPVVLNGDEKLHTSCYNEVNDDLDANDDRDGDDRGESSTDDSDDCDCLIDRPEGDSVGREEPHDDSVCPRCGESSVFNLPDFSLGGCPVCGYVIGQEEKEEEEYDDSWQYDDSLDGDHESGLASAGFGTDEDYGDYGDELHPTVRRSCGGFTSTTRASGWGAPRVKQTKCHTLDSSYIPSPGATRSRQ